MLNMNERDEIEQLKNLQLFVARKMRNARVLVVDDDEASILNLLSVLASYGAKVKVVSSGEKMVNELWRRNYDVVFLDRLMPELRGELALFMADGRVPRNKKTPVIFFSGSEEELKLLPLFQFKVLEVWNKQLTYKNLMKRVADLLRKVNPTA